MALMIRGHQDFWPKQRDLVKLEGKFYEYKGLTDAAHKFGSSFSKELAQSKQLVDEANELRDKINEITGKNERSIDWAIMYMRSEVEKLLGQYKYANEIGILAQALINMSEGKYLYNVIRELEKVIDRLKKDEDSIS